MKKLIGELLIENGLITPEQLDEALGVQRKDGDLIGNILVNLGYLDDDALLEYLKMQGTIIKMHEKN